MGDVGEGCGEVRPELEGCVDGFADYAFDVGVCDEIWGEVFLGRNTDWIGFEVLDDAFDSLLDS